MRSEARPRERREAATASGEMEKIDPKQWDKAVTFQFSLGELFNLRTTEAAACYLLLRWPAAGGAAQSLDVLEGKEPPDVARTAFMAACEKAGMLVVPEEVFMRNDPGQLSKRVIVLADADRGASPPIIAAAGRRAQPHTTCTGRTIFIQPKNEES